MPKAISYQLLIHLKKSARIRVGALGEADFKTGYYIYSGSARRNLEARVARHCRKEKPLRWHIDYLTSHPDALIVATRTSPVCECRLNWDVKGGIPLVGFGASDCRQGCGAHLKYLGRKRPGF